MPRPLIRSLWGLPQTRQTGASGPYEASKWRVLQWDAANETYREFPDLDSTDLRAGNAFWPITKKGTPPSIREAKTVDASTPRAVEIEPGWNQVGTPSPYPVPWDTVRTGSGFAASALDGPYRRQEGRFQQASSLPPWRGYFVFNATATMDTLWIPPVNANNADKARGTSGAAARTKRRATKSRTGYALRVTAQTKGGTSTATLGLRTDAN
ncbi:MAG: hypothetical protein BRD55_05420 [Bacteroidetes bacterium SW_9_63_38]|nr:MAG: hypothetical protein BRD55_05420 [Bacteroidetes bacterium SW_9_63_38]